ncbi:RNA polymerase sigma-70 factor [Chitinophaga sp. MM2321]|uniref:RNA polymerase sigma factor n=1 Tax=Chitinophaga sp. MM2321 TaxID=3137178 RepID=UPI0032D572FB
MLKPEMAEELFIQYTQQLASGDQQALRQLVLYFSPSLHRFAYSIVGNEQEAEEVVSDVFVKLWRQRDHLPPPGALKYYLYKSVRNTALNYIKHNSRRAAGHYRWEVLVSNNKTPTPEDFLITKENLHAIRDAIQALPPRCQEVFILVKEEGLSYAEVANLLDISVATVNVQITIALKKIWTTLEPVLHLPTS